MPGPLTDMRVLDLSRVLAGPYCTMMLADLGADVIKVEAFEGDETRRFGPPFVGDESTYFLSVNRGKRSVAIDLKHNDGQRLALELARWADVVVDNFRPGAADKLGVGYAALSSANPRLVYASVSGYGLSGAEPYTTLPGYDLVIQGVGGIASLTGPVGGAPYKMGTSVADMVSGLNALAAILAALHAREESGKGVHLDIGMLDGQLSMLTYHASAWLNAGQRPARLGNAHPSICPYETFRAGDGWLNIACGNDGQFAALCSALEQNAWVADPRFATNARRVENREALLALLAPLLAQQPLAHWLERIGEAGVPCGPILEVPEALAHAQAQARGMLVVQEHPTAGTVRTVGSPLGFGTPTFATLPPPRLGEHTDQVLRDVLGHDSATIEDLRRRGAVQ
ncbi:MAG: CoA transferase [Deltaproteobacteria bacterium]|nr:CoA transferase [Deltaproteobacteria bacterium]